MPNFVAVNRLNLSPPGGQDPRLRFNVLSIDYVRVINCFYDYDYDYVGVVHNNSANATKTDCIGVAYQYLTWKAWRVPKHHGDRHDATWYCVSRAAKSPNWLEIGICARLDHHLHSPGSSSVSPAVEYVIPDSDLFLLTVTLIVREYETRRADGSVQL